jgi:hypothetical protein
MNVGRVAIGGLVAGLVINVCDFVVNNYLLAKEWRHVAQARNIDTAVMGGPTALATFVVVDWTYAAIRPRLGPGPATASVAAIAVFLAPALVMATLAGVFFSWDMYIKTQALFFGSVLLGSLTGAFWYSEPEPPPAPDAEED